MYIYIYIYFRVPKWSFLAWSFLDHFFILFKAIPHGLCKPIHNLKSYAQKANSRSLVASMTAQSGICSKQSSPYFTLHHSVHMENQYHPARCMCSQRNMSLNVQWEPYLEPSYCFQVIVRLPCGLAPKPLRCWCMSWSTRAWGLMSTIKHKLNKDHFGTT